MKHVSLRAFYEGSIIMGRNSFIKLFVILSFAILLSCTDDQPLSTDIKPGDIVGLVKPIGINAEIDLYQGVLLKTVTTDSSGYFEIDSVTSGIYNLEVHADGYGGVKFNSIVVYSGSVTAIPDVILSKLPEQILAINPSNGSERFPLDSPIKIDFSTLMNHNSVEDNFFLVPDVKGEFVWEDDAEKNSVTFYPSDQYISNFSYLLMLTTDIFSLYGDSLAFNVLSYFNTEGVKITSTIPNDQATYISPIAGIYINFNSKMNRQSVEQGFSIEPAAIGDFKWFDSKRLLFQPGNYLASSTLYSFSISSSAKDIYNTLLFDEITVSFQTEPLTITSNYPIHGASGINRSSPVIITFNTSVDKQSVENAFSIIPELPGWEFQWNDFTRVQFSGSTRMQANISYIVTVDTTCSDIMGNKLPKTKIFSFTTGS